MYISLWENSWGHPDNVSFMQFSTKIDGFEQKDSQGFENSYNSYEQYPLEKFLIFTIYQNYTLALTKFLKWDNGGQRTPGHFLFDNLWAKRSTSQGIICMMLIVCNNAITQ